MRQTRGTRERHRVREEEEEARGAHRAPHQGRREAREDGQIVREDARALFVRVGRESRGSVKGRLIYQGHYKTERERGKEKSQKNGVDKVTSLGVAGRVAGRLRH